MPPLSRQWITNWHRLTAIPVDPRSAGSDAWRGGLNEDQQARQAEALTNAYIEERRLKRTTKPKAAPRKRKPTAADRRYMEMQAERERYRGIGPIPDELL